MFVRPQGPRSEARRGPAPVRSQPTDLRTVEARRKRVLEKMGTRSLSEIAGALNRVGLLGPSALPDAPTEADD